MIVKGKAWKFGDDVYNEQIIAGIWSTRGVIDPAELSKHIFEIIDPMFPRKVNKGDIVVAGNNFGAGSIRVHTIVGLKYAGIAAIIANSFSSGFYRNAVNQGLPVLECKGITKKVKNGDNLEINFKKGEIKNLNTQEIFNGDPMPEIVWEVVSRGGLISYTIERLAKR